MLEWGKASEFAEKKFRRSKSLHTKRYYENGVRRFRQYCEEKRIVEVDEESVYGVLDGFVGWLDLQGIKPKTLNGYVHAAKKFLLFLDIRIDPQRFREKVEQPRILKIEDEPAPEKPSSKWSFGNQVLMLLAGTLDARGYKQWTEVGRHVRAGAKAFRILGPVYVKKHLDTDSSEDEEVEVLVGFKAIPVFRLEDTEGAELPVYKPRNPPPLLEVAERFGMKVNYLRLSAGVYGMTDYERQVINLATEDWTVFWHELAHAVHRSYEPKTSHGQELEAETVAQLVAATLARLYGRPDDSFSWTYIATQAQTSSPQQVGRLCLRVLDRAKKVLDLIYESPAALP